VLVMLFFNLLVLQGRRSRYLLSMLYDFSLWLTTYCRHYHT